MSDIKFSCPQCGQHIACGAEWAGHTLECPSCHSSMLVPQAPAAAPQPSATVESPKQPSPGARLASGAARSPSPKPQPAPARRQVPPPPSGDNSLLKYGFLLLVVLILGGLVYYYVVPQIGKALEPSANTPGTSEAGSRRGGPLGEVNDAMDVSETLDGGSSSRRPQQPATNNPVRPRPAAPGR